MGRLHVLAELTTFLGYTIYRIGTKTRFKLFKPRLFSSGSKTAYISSFGAFLVNLFKYQAYV